MPLSERWLQRNKAIVRGPLDPKQVLLPRDSADESTVLDLGSGGDGEYADGVTPGPRAEGWPKGSGWAPDAP